MTLTPSDVAEMSALEANATKGPVDWQKFGQEYCLVGQYGMRPIILSVKPSKFQPSKLQLRNAKLDLLVDFTRDHPDAQYIAAAYNFIPKALAQLQANQQAIEAKDRTIAELTDRVAQLTACIESRDRKKTEQAETIRKLKEALTLAMESPCEGGGTCICDFCDWAKKLLNPTP